MLPAFLLLVAISAGLPPAKPFPIEQAVAGIDGEGPLAARIETDAGTIVIRLFEKRAPKTVANFVGLARGLIAFRDTKPKSEEDWVKRPFYDGLTFHRRIPKFLIQGGCPLGDGRGGPGYFVADEFHAELRHDQPGTVSMVNDGPDTNGSQFFITEAAAPHLDDRNPVFGRVVSGMEVVHAIARAERSVRIETIVVFRR